MSEMEISTVEKLHIVFPYSLFYAFVFRNIFIPFISMAKLISRISKVFLNADVCCL